MKTKKQVMDEFFRLQKKYADIMGFATIDVYNSEGGIWTVTIKVCHFSGPKIDWDERVTWEHYSYTSESTEAENEARVAEFVKRMEERLK